MASIERTAFPRFKRVVSARELHESFTPWLDEIEWARAKSRGGGHLLALVVWLKSYQRLGYFPDLFEVPEQVVQRVRGYLELPAQVEPVHESERTEQRHRELVRVRVGVLYDPEQARKVAEQAIRVAVQSKDNPADLINVALEELVRTRLELPGYSTLDEMAAAIRAEVNAGYYRTIHDRIGDMHRDRLVGLLRTDRATRRSRFDGVKKPAGSARLSRVPGAPDARGLARQLGGRVGGLDGRGAGGEGVELRGVGEGD